MAGPQHTHQKHTTQTRRKATTNIQTYTQTHTYRHTNIKAHIYNHTILTSFCFILKNLRPVFPVLGKAREQKCQILRVTLLGDVCYPLTKMTYMLARPVK